MRSLSLLVVSLLMMFPVAQTLAAKKDLAPIPFTMGWHVFLGPNGHVLRLTPIKNARIDRIPQIRARLEQEIHGWQFLAGTVAGKPSPTESGLYLSATLTVVKNNTIRIRVDSAVTGATTKKQLAPRYPAEAIRAGKTGEVVLRVGYDADGNVTLVAPYPDGPTADKALVEASIKAMKRWKFQPEIVGGHALAGYAIVPFCYSLNHLGDGHKQIKCDWKRPGNNLALPNGEALALNPAVKLLTHVAGRTL